MSERYETNQYIPLTVETLSIGPLHEQRHAFRRGHPSTGPYNARGPRVVPGSSSPEQILVPELHAVEGEDIQHQSYPSFPLPQTSSIFRPGISAPDAFNSSELAALPIRRPARQGVALQPESDAMHHQADNNAGTAKNIASSRGISASLVRRHSDSELDSHAGHHRAVTPPATSKHFPSDESGQQWPFLTPRVVHFGDSGLSPNFEYQRPPSPFPMRNTTPAPTTPRPSEVPYSVPQYAVPIYQPSGWPYAAYGQPFEATSYPEPPQRPLSIYDVPLTDRGSISNLLRSLHDIVLLGFPLLYHRRLARVREKADLPQPVAAWAMDATAPYPFQPPQRQSSIPPIYHAGTHPQMTHGGYLKGPRVQWDGFRDEWETFVFASTQEWQTLNIISALLLSAILTILGIDDAGHNIITRTAALMALVSALISLGFGGAYTIRFSSLKTPRRGFAWVLEAKTMTSPLIWNIWTFLSLPAAWLAWSVLFFCITIASFVWTSGDRQTPFLDWDSNGGAGVDAIRPTSTVVLVPRVLVSALFLIGLVYAIQAARFLTRWAGLNASVKGDGKKDV